LLLRGDLHTLFDLGLFAVDSETMTVIVSPRLATTAYASLALAPLRLPPDISCRPSVDALDRHRAWAAL
jgi:hypothetical protein